MFARIFSLYKSIRARVSARTVNRIVFFVLAFAGIGLLIIMEQYADWGRVMRVVQSIPWPGIVLVAGFPLITYGLAALRWKYILSGYGYDIAFGKLFVATCRGAAISNIIPSFEISGETYKAAQVQRFGVSKPAAFASIFFDFLIVFGVNALCGLLMLGYVILLGWRGVTVAGIVAVPIGFVLVAIAMRTVLRRGWFVNIVKRSVPMDTRDLEAVGLFDYGISFFLKEAMRYLHIGVLITFVGWLWEIGQLIIVASYVHIPLHPFTIAVLYVGITFFNSMPVFGGIGFGEAGAFLAGASVQIPDTNSMALMFLLRVKQIATIVIGSALILVSYAWELVREHMQERGGA